jgi:hypothetical protein
MKPEPMDLGLTTEDFSLEALEMALETVFRQTARTLRCGSMACAYLYGVLLRVHDKYCEAMGLSASDRRQSLRAAAEAEERRRQIHEP